MKPVHAETADTAESKVFRFDQSGALLSKVMESAAVGMAVLGEDGRMIFANRAYETMLGYGPGECLGRTGEDMLHHEDRQLMLLRFRQLMRDEAGDFQIECRMRHADGGAVWVLASAALVRSDTTGRPLYSIVQIINIDRQKRAEAALADSESRWNFALESAGQGVWDHDIRRDDMFYSRMWRRMRGIPEDEQVDPAQEAWLARVHPEDVPRIVATVKKQDHGEDGYDTLEYRERHRDGHWMWILSRGKPVEWDAEGNPIRTVGTDTDITRLKLAEARLAEEKERLRVTLESIAEGVIATGADGCVTFMNPVAEALTGWREPEALGHPLWRVFVTKREATGEPAPDILGNCLAAGAPVRIETDVVMVARDGTGRGVSGVASPVRMGGERASGAVLVFKDATDDQEQQRRLAHSAHHDPLTGLPNRAAFGRALAEACQQAGEGRWHTLCFIDLDRFKPVNDSAGHAAGDALLQKVAQVIRLSCRPSDYAGRLGGDEFVVLLADSTPREAEAQASRLAAAIAAIDFTWNGATYRIGASIGLAPAAPDAERALAAADAACYAAKAAGRGGVAIASK